MALHYSLATSLVRNLCRLLGGWQVVGRENFPKTGGAILAPNHVSFMDPPVAGSACPRQPWFMAKSELFRPPVFGTLIRWCRAFPVKRGTADRAALRRAEELLERGEVVLVFAQGGRFFGPGLGEPEMGLGMLALRAKVPIVPMAVLGTEQTLPRHAKFLHRGKTVVYIGEPLAFPELYEKPKPTKEDREFVAHEVMRALGVLLERACRERGLRHPQQGATQGTTEEQPAGPAGGG